VTDYEAKLDRLLEAIDTVSRRLDAYEAQLDAKDRPDCRSDFERIWPGDPIQRRIRRTTYH
jgi:hypothetical protein